MATSAPPLPGAHHPPQAARRTPTMYSAPRSPHPESFRVTVSGADASGLLGHSMRLGDTHDRPLPPGKTPDPSRRPDRQSLVHDARLWWDDWIPVATTGWGALVLIVPLLVAQVVLGIVGGKGGGGHVDEGPDVEG